ncbi:DUF6882 domain-containing protein [Streptomyces sp. BE303]|uniref:DUF6882 domain-containing protein n=1 Tax=Streptomyces sp. BE303 TaxID=3002528 RepID=UPI002E78C124|nr:DUF6882 domain-containing protein [Streptomyces sp. BE303]MED7947858.1 hypothetical protein [Streptomyces sp. BE303]
MSNFSDAFLHEAERHAAWGTVQLQAMDAAFPDAPWDVDLDTGVYQQDGRKVRVAVLATYDLSERTWMWGWANPGLRGAPVVAAAERVRDFGRAHGLTEFTEETLDLSGFADPRRAAETLAFTAMGVTGAPGYLGLEAGPSTRLYLLPVDPRIAPAGVDPLALPRILTSSTTLIGRSPRLVVSGYFDHFRMAQRQTETGISADLPNGGTVDVDFDGSGRIASVRVHPAGR